MFYPQDIEIKLGFDKIKEQIHSKCTSSLGQSLIDKIRFTSKFELVSKLLKQTKEFMQIINSGDSFSVGEFVDVSSSLKKSSTIGAFCTELELLDIAKSTTTLINCLTFIDRRKEEYPHLHELGKYIVGDISIGDDISDKIDKEGRVKDNASTHLSEIRVSLRSKYNQVRKSLQSIYKNSIAQGYVPEGASITVRDGRMVIPVLTEYKRRVPGFVHDESSTGSTIFLEPTAVLEGNNEIRELEYAEKREVIKILTKLTDLVRVNLPLLESGLSYLSKLDFIRAKAKFSNDIDAIVPEINNKAYIDWKTARHPLLLRALEKEGKSIIPLSVKLDANSRLVIISGPNAGGKSVSLKTVGLLQYMLQCGLPIPLEESSTAGIFTKVFIDIGDEQSLENDLSTYSSHLKSMKFFLQNADKETLCLIDEFGTGTDPQFGGAIAEAVLKKLNEQKSYGIITTHYSNIKNFAESTDGIVNGAMRFDMEKLEPLFQLEIGKPGSSFSLEIARKTGLSDDIIKYAKEKIGDKSIDVDDLLNRLERQKQEIKSRDERLKQRETEVQKLEGDYKKLYEELESDKKGIIKKAKDEAAKLLSDTNKEIEKTIRHIKSNNAQKSETRKVRDRLKTLKEKVDEPKLRVKPLKKDNSIIEVGDNVKLIDQDVTGTVMSIKGNDLEVQIGLLKTKLKKERVEKISKGVTKAIKKQKAATSHGMNLTSKLSEFSTTLDVRGKRAEEVMSELDRYLDDAILFGLNEVKILHGKGNGVLREVVRNYARSQSFVASATDEHMERGGSGITVIGLK